MEAKALTKKAKKTFKKKSFFLLFYPSSAFAKRRGKIPDDGPKIKKKEIFLFFFYEGPIGRDK